MISLVITIAVTLIAQGFLFFVMTFILKQAKSDKQLLNTSANDQLDIEYKSKLINSDILSGLINIIGFAGILIAMLYINFNNWYNLVILLPYAFITFSNYTYGQKVNHLKYPSIQYDETMYIDKVIDSMDEGERYISLKYLFQTYYFNLNIISILIMGVIVISWVNHRIELVAFVVLIILYIVNFFNYSFNIRKHNQKL